MMDRLATAGRKDAFPFTAATVHDSEYDFSFSGLKTAVINCVHTRELRGQPLDEETKADIAASFTDALVRTIVTRRLAGCMSARTFPRSCWRAAWRRIPTCAPR